MKILALFSVLLFALSACSTEEVQGECKRDGDCDPGFRCSADYRCLCLDDNSCAEDEYCNTAGYCQKYSGCHLDSDCGNPDHFTCQVAASGHGTCLCTSDLACAEDEVCNPQGACELVVGCQLDSDCGDPEDWMCQVNPVTDIGECVCQTDNACSEGEFCNEYHYCQPEAVCTSDENCPEGKYCDLDSGECLCDFEAQTGCIEGEVCNELGYCQPIPGCYTNEDCIVPDTFCDVTSSKCMPLMTCNSDLQCPLEYICDPGLRECVEGCRGNDDCPLDKFCLEGGCVEGCQAEIFCDLAEFCQNNSCVSDYSQQRPYCEPCTAFSPCPTNASGNKNWCLIYNNGPDEFSAQHDNYCAPSCDDDADCPHGFDCGELIDITNGGQCGPGCEHETCASGLPCIQDEEEECGFCPCHDTLQPCQDDICMLGTCVLSGESCTTSADCEIPCVKFEGEDYGYCVIGKSCGLQEGYHCPLSMPP